MTLNHLQSNSFELFLKRSFLILAVLVIMFSLPASADAFAGGDGSEENPWQIADAAHLQQIGQAPSTLNCDYILTDSITLSFVWTPVGSFENPFTGNLNGNGHTIHGLTIDTSSPNAGLFAQTQDAVNESSARTG